MNRLTRKTFARLAGDLRHDVRFALRLFRRHPTPIVIAIGGLGVAIGVATAAFSIVNASLLRPYAMDDPSSVVRVAQSGEPAWAGWPYAQFQRMRDETTLATVEAAWPERVRFSTTPAADERAERPTLLVSGGYLPTLGGRPLLGRTLGPDDDRPGAVPAIVVSERFWKTELNGDPAVIGKTVWVNDTPIALVGVMRPDFTGPVRAPVSLWATFAAGDALRLGPLAAAADARVQIIARLRVGASLSALQAGLTALVARPSPAGPRGSTARAVPGVRLDRAASPIDSADAETYLSLACLLALIGLIVALACANVATLLMAAAMTRTQEIGVRLAMGASKGRLVRQLVHESLLLASIAGGVGFLLAFWLVPIFGSMTGLTDASDLAPDARVLLFTSALALVCGLGAGLSPARFAARGNVLAALQSQSRSHGTGPIASRVRRSVVGFQAAASVLLLLSAALFGRTALLVAHTGVGFDVDRLLAVSLQRPPSGLDEPAYVRAAAGAIRALPGVDDVSIAETEPFGPSREVDRVTRAGGSYELVMARADAAFFTTTGVRILRGRPFTTAEVETQAPVALISDSVARAFFSGRDPIGQSLAAVPSSRSGRQDPVTIVGVAADAMLTSPDSQTYGTIYRPFRPRPARSNPPSLLIRTTNPHAAAPLVEDALRSLDPRTRATPRIVRDTLDAFLGAKQRLAWMLAPAAAIALLLSALGMYGVSAFVTGQRTEEVSVRTALGASPADVWRLLLTDGLRPVVAGLAAGLVAGLVVAPLLARPLMLSGISPHDPLSIAVAVATVLASALVAVILPARRTARADPAALLRRQ
jgi:predicted permease